MTAHGDPMRYHMPIATADTVFGVLEELGVRAWEKVSEPIPLGAYLSRPLSDFERSELRFAPAIEAMPLRQPNGHPFTGFRAIGRPWVTTIALLPDDLIPLVGEWKHGSETLTLAPPSGIIEDHEHSNPEQSALREFEEECGIALAGVQPLAGSTGIPTTSRQSTARVFPYLGIIRDPLIVSERKLDETEHLQPILLPLAEWLTVIERGIGIDDYAISATFLALRKLERLSLQ